MCCCRVNTCQQQVSDCKRGGFPAPSCVGIAGTGPTIPSVSAPPALSSTCFSKPICSAFAIITCLPSLWQGQAPGVPHRSLSFSSSHSSRPYFRAHFTSSLKGPGGILPRSLSKPRLKTKKRSSNGDTHKSLKKKDIHLWMFYSERATLCQQTPCWVVVVDHFSPSGRLLQF